MIVCHVVEPFATGINTFIHELVHGMPDYEHIVIHGERKDTREIEALKKEYSGNVKFIKWENAHRDISLKWDIRAFFELRKKLKKIDFDVLHLHSSKAGVLGRLIGFFDGYKNVVYTPNGASFLRKDISKSKIRHYQKIENFFSKFNCTIVSSSVSEQNAHADIDIKTKVIQNGVLVNRTIEKREKNNVFNIITCGKITIQKNPAFLNEIASFFKNDKEVSFTWIGEGELRSELSNVNITGWCSKEEVFNHLSKADLYLSTSSWEGLPLAGIEAMAFGVPLLMNECVGNNDLVNRGINGYIFDSRIKAIEDIEYLKHNPDILQKLSDNSLKMYERHYNNFRCAKDYDDLYKAIRRKVLIANV